MKIRVEVDGTVEEIDIAVDSLTLQEAVAVQAAIGDDGWDDIAEGKVRPMALQALVFAKLTRSHPGLTIEDFDCELKADSEEVPTSGVG